MIKYIRNKIIKRHEPFFIDYQTKENRLRKKTSLARWMKYAKTLMPGRKNFFRTCNGRGSNIPEGYHDHD